MKKNLLVILALTTIAANSAVAADMPLKAPVKAPPLEVYNWSGIYLGASVGGAWTEPHRFYPNLPEVGIPPTTFVSRSTDGIYDIHGGAQLQFGQWVVGVEATYVAGIDRLQSSVSVSPPEPFTHLAATTRITDLWMVGPRLGFAWNRFMAYGTGGYAAARLVGSYSCGDTGIPVLPGPGDCSAIFGPVIRNLDFTLFSPSTQCSRLGCGASRLRADERGGHDRAAPIRNGSRAGASWILFVRAKSTTPHRGTRSVRHGCLTMPDGRR